MPQEKRTSTGPISRVHVDRREREADYVMPSHHCPPYYELSYIEEGACRFLVEDGMYDLGEGDFLLIPPQTIHYTRYLLGPCHRCGVYFRPEDLDAGVVSLLPGRQDFFAQMCILKTPPEARRRIEELESILKNAEVIVNSDGTTSFLPNRSIWFAAFAVVIVLCILLYLVSRRIRFSEKTA